MMLSFYMVVATMDFTISILDLFIFHLTASLPLPIPGNWHHRVGGVDVIFIVLI